MPPPRSPTSRVVPLALSFAAGLIAAGCSEPQPDKAAPTGAPVTHHAAAVPAEPAGDLEGAVGAAAADSERRCTADDQCVLVTEDCCGCNGGGRQIGVNKAKLEALGARRVSLCAGIACPAQMSDDASCDAHSARCVSGMCAPAVAGSVPPKSPGTAGVAIEPIGEPTAKPVDAAP